MELKYLDDKNYDWDDIEINEIVSFTGCNYIVIKEGKYKARVLADDTLDMFYNSDCLVEVVGEKHTANCFTFKQIVDHPSMEIMTRKLSTETQNLWKCE